ncbi:LADA_0G06678g1_1 [Lachancea dasiensis]|uniref:LADA_0G06678g1_1 n=1 Tax=Lachancea dasiensis TaxID=1072105 RepID=A0A1G4JTA0_9SACH|nr:LADA_0G06678g1_1 [Lachancea dasiensis]
MFMYVNSIDKSMNIYYIYCIYNYHNHYIHTQAHNALPIQHTVLSWEYYIGPRMDSELSSVELDEEVYENSPDVLDDEVAGSEPEEDDDYQYTPEFEEDEESAQVNATGRPKKGRSKLEEEDEDVENTVRGSGRKRATTDELDEPDSSPAKRARRNGAIDLRTLGEADDEDDEDDAVGGIGEGSASSSATEKAREMKTNNRNKMMMELLDHSSRRNSKLSEKELQLRRAENARKRKNLSEKRLEEEKQDTINKLLRRRAGRTRGPSSSADGEGVDGDEDTALLKPRRSYNSNGMTRLITNKDGTVYATY